MAVLKMERPMDNWNDDRLDEMSRRMDDGFKETNERSDRRFDRVENRIDRIYYGCIALMVVLIGNSVAGTFWG